MFRRILVAVDGSEPARWAVEVAASMAQSMSSSGARVSLVNVVDASDAAGCGGAGLTGSKADVRRALRREGRRVLREAADLVPAPLCDELLLREGRAADEILAAAREWGADLIVVGTHGRAVPTPFLIGATADATARRSACPVMVVARRPRPAPALGSYAALATG